MIIDKKSTPSKRYSQELQNTHWKLKADNIRIRDKHKCRLCNATDTQLDVHHLRYIEGREPWEYDDGDLVTLCHKCHEKLHNEINFYQLKEWDYFYHKVLDGVGIVSHINANSLEFHICWTETEKDVPEHGRIWFEDQAYPEDIRPATSSEIWDFWDKLLKYYGDEESLKMLISFERMLAIMPPRNHPIWKLIEPINRAMHEKMINE